MESNETTTLQDTTGDISALHVGDRVGRDDRVFYPGQRRAALAVASMRGRSRFGRQSYAFTLLELLVVMGILAFLSAIVLPVFFYVHESGRQTACVSNMRQLAAALTLYTQDADGYFPTHPEKESDPFVTWAEQIWPYVKIGDVFQCPNCILPPGIDLNAQATSRGYAMNMDISGAFDGSSPSAQETSLRFPSNTVTLCESGYTSGPGQNQYGVVVGMDEPQTDRHLNAGVAPLGLPGALRHRSGSNCGFADGHVYWHRPEENLDESDEWPQHRSRAIIQPINRAQS